MNSDMLSENTNVPIKDYIRNIRKRYYSELDISFMDLFMDMYNSREYVSAELLATYGVLSIKPNRKTLDGNHIERFLKKCHLKENTNYRIRPQLGANSRGAPKNMYYLTPKAFKICLMNSENETKYREYYLLLEECIHYYNIGQIEMYKSKILDLEEDLNTTNKYVSELEEETIEQEDKIKQLFAKLDVMIQQNEEMSNKMDDMKLQNENIIKQNDEMKLQNEEMKVTLNNIVKKLDDRAIPPSNNEFTERFVLMKKNENTYYVIRSQERRIGKAVTEKEELGYTKIPDLLDSELIPNSIYLWNCIRDELVKEKKIICKYNSFKLRNITEYDLVDMIKQVFDSRKKIQ